MEDWSPPEELDEYRLVRLLGRGAMGQVYLAHDQLLDRPVAVKFVRAAEDPAARARALEEARAIARLHHPNVVAIYRVAETAGRPYLVSEYVRGKTLDELPRPVPWKQVLSLAIDLSRGLAAAHRGGVLHRDVKPANAIVTEDGRGKLLDFGLARAIDAEPVFLPPRERADSPLPSAIDATASAIAPVRVRGSSPSASSEDSFDPNAADKPLQLGSPDVQPREAGTPLYMAPELWRGEPASRRSDLYSLGVLLYELVAGTAPHRGTPIAELAAAVQAHDIPRLATVADGVDAGFAAVIDRLVERDAGARFASADALLIALEDIAEPAPSAQRRANIPDGNPYRGLAAFESGHGALFFGRRGEIRELVDRIANDPIVVVGGDSGTGKSSLCRAGVLPWLVEHAGWSRVDIVPGRHPVRSLAAGLAGFSGQTEEQLATLLRDSPDAVAGAIRQHLRGRTDKLLLFVDQLEELMTQSDREEARAVGATLAALGMHTSSVRVLATARSDFLSRLATLPGLGEDLGRALYFLRPLTSDRIREAIVRPAAVKGVTFESDALVDQLVEQTALAPGGLPLLQFTLAELWDSRDADAKIIRTDALTALGGVEGALSRHADHVIAGIEQRDGARRLLLRLVSADGTRARRSDRELVTTSAERSALEALVRGRIVVANDEQFEVAHEALITSWPALQDWRRKSAADHAVRVRLEHAAGLWDRMNRSRDLLWNRRQLAELRAFELDAIAPRETAFVDASRRSLARKRIAAGAIAVVVAATAIAVTLTVRARARRELEHVIGEHAGRANAAFAEARSIGDQRDIARAKAFELFDGHRWTEGEEAWTEAETLAAREAASYRDASRSYETALSLDPSRGESRKALADLLFARLLRAERDRDRNLIEELSARLVAYDDGGHQAALTADAHIDLVVEPIGAKVFADGAPIGIAPLSFAHPPGTVALSFEAPGRAPVRLPILLEHGASSKLSLTLPTAAVVPMGMIYIPPGRFLFGSADSTDLRRGFLSSPPIHEVATGAYLIAQHEVTFGEWIEWLDTLPEDQRKLRRPSSITTQNALELVESGPKQWRLSFTPTTKTYNVELGQQVHYEKRLRRAVQDWSKFPVSAVSYADAQAYTAWLATGKVPHARLCDEYEWERAARGADGRTYPGGATLAADDANFDITYGREPLGFGPDEVGSHPRSRSPFGVDDMAGNAWEWTTSVAIPGTPVYRGGGWYNAELSSRSVNREPGEPTQRNVLIGIRVCADAH